MLLVLKYASNTIDVEMAVVKKRSSRCLFDSNNRVINELRDVLNPNCPSCLTHLEHGKLYIYMKSQDHQLLQ
jgi:hypothetical protein